MKQPRAVLRRRILQLERCLRDVLVWCSDRHIELNARGADHAECEEWRELQRLRRRVWRTLPPNAPYGLNLKTPQNHS